MKALVTIESVKVSRKVQRNDGTWGNVYGITLVTGDDKILAESFRTDESLKKIGVVPGAIGTATLEFKVSEGISKVGNQYCIQNINLRSFELPRDLRQTDQTGAPSPSWTQEHKSEEATAEQVAEGMAEAAAAAEENLNPDDLPY